MKRSTIERCRTLRRNQTDAEKKLWTILRNRQLNGIKFRRQFPVGRYILDFYCSEYKFAIEADGSQHYELMGKKRDALREEELKKLGVEIIRFGDQDILTNIDGVYEAILKTIDKIKIAPSPQSSPPRGERRKLML